MTVEHEEAPSGQTPRERVLAILAAFHGRTTAITEAGKDNMRTVNRLTRVAPLRHIGNDRTFRHNLARYQMDGLEEEVLIGARREGNGVWSLVAELVPPRP
ncbi:MAG TPA: hypothetical protein VNL71_17750 [Chloroflexota bacterium]|nr:hypothetical protein [Chloroflexota bacterium]